MYSLLKRSGFVMLQIVFLANIIYAQQRNGQHDLLKAATVFGDNMVIQQGIKAPVWGEGSPKEKIKIELAGTITTARADENGRWMAKMPVLKAGGPYQMKISGNGNMIEFRNVMIGEVWLASGQSNMSFALNKASNAKEEISRAENPFIRLLTVPVYTAPVALTDIHNASWKICAPEDAAAFSAVAYFFAQELYKSKKVAIGIINASLGSSSAEAWCSRDLLEELPDFRDRVIKLDQDTAAWNAKVAAIKDGENMRTKIAVSAREGLKLGVQLPGYNDSGWKESVFPMNMSKLNLPGYWGFVWFRKEFNLTPDEAVKELKMELPIYADEFLLYFNGTETGGRYYKQPFPASYPIPKELVKTGRNVIAIRMRTYFGTGRIGTDSTEKPRITSSDNVVDISIAGTWKFNASIEPRLAPNQEYFNTPTVLYNAMISPLIPFAMKGVIWYQGETNASRPVQYRTLFPALIKDWRGKWGEGDFPFLFVQLASRQKEGIADMQYALAREAQTYALHLPNTGMATAVDLGEKNETHPKNKRDVGVRLALAARKIAYGNNIEYSGPVYQSMKTEGHNIRLSFSHTGAGLIMKGKELKGFKIAGSDGVFYPGIATISGTTVVVNSPLVLSPVAIRYCFESWSEGNLYNREGLAAPQFRTDNWEVIKNSK